MLQTGIPVQYLGVLLNFLLSFRWSPSRCELYVEVEVLKNTVLPGVLLHQCRSCLDHPLGPNNWETRSVVCRRDASWRNRLFGLAATMWCTTLNLDWLLVFQFWLPFHCKHRLIFSFLISSLSSYYTSYCTFVVRDCLCLFWSQDLN